ncbi:methyltransferase domain-containing protein [Zoogloea sp.]|uniref:class I SAM-dependent methyltransferase n=1 Tax=Zoogloea sp. TaxID=49181 RepID=UPI002602A4C5|nr:methyltransferase domain-containing protein [Zoogloea sp.]MDD3354419.1 methyltransferase domain-containing protein [Zoogloea sp.]
MPPLESFPGLHAWLGTPLGRHVLDWEQARMDERVSDIFGYNAVQLGIPEADFLKANRMPLRFRAGAGAVQVQASQDALPFAASSLDLVVLPHVLEFASNPHQVLREVERVLVPEGSVVISGFNPFSLFGLRRLLAGRSGVYPWHGQYLSQRRLKDWLTLLSFETHAQTSGCFIPAVEQQQWIDRLALVNRAGERWWPIAGGVYIIHAIKRAHGMRLIMPKWERKAGARALAPLVQKSGGPDRDCSRKNTSESDFGRD